jgi:hypothetical protein
LEFGSRGRFSSTKYSSESGPLGENEKGVTFFLK